jgi:hypothetical protein
MSTGPSGQFSDKVTSSNQFSSKPSSSTFSNKTVYILLGGAAVLVLICGGVFMWLVLKSLGGASAGVQGGDPKVNLKATYPKGDDAFQLKDDEVMKAFFSELRGNQLEDAYQRTSVAFQTQLSFVEFKELIEKNRAVIGHLNMRYKVFGGEAGGKTYKVHVTGGPNGSTDCTLVIGAERGGGRKIHQFSIP